MQLGQTLLNIRKERGMTQEEFAKIFHVTRQTVSNWENEKNYPDLQTLVNISEEFNISLDIMLKEDKQMVKKLSREIKFGRKTKLAVVWGICILAVILTVSGFIWFMLWKNAGKINEEKFKNGVAEYQFVFDEAEKHYIKTVDDDTYFALPNQKMPGYFDFTLDFHADFLDSYTKSDDQPIWMRWGEFDGEVKITIYYLDKNGDIEHTLSDKEKEKLYQKDSRISELKDIGIDIYKSVYNLEMNSKKE